jgi:general secretion pathway protein L
LSDTLVIMLGDAPRWLRVSDGAVVARGDGAVLADLEDDRVVAVVPAQDVTIQHASLPDLSEPQAAAAARLLVAEQAASPLDTLHVAIGRDTGDGERPVVSIDRARMALWLAEANVLGHDPDAVIAAPMLLARPERGYVRADLGTETVVRGIDSAFADDPVLTPLVTGGVITALDRPTLEANIAAAVANPEVDLRQGIFAKKSAWALDWPMLRLIGWLALALGVVTLMLQVVYIVRLNSAARRIEAQSVETARTALPPGTTINSPLIQLNERLAALRGPGGGVLSMATGVATAIHATPNTQLTSMIFDGGGTLRVTVRGGAPADMSGFDARLAAAGVNTAPGPLMVDQGKQVRDYTVIPQ